jgi:Ran GTPase-activating protein (RanGAP) involved in mRNA processing and transport
MGNSYGSQFFKELEPFFEKIESISKVLFNDIFTSRTDEILESIETISRLLKDKNVILFNMSDNAVCPDGCLRLE